MQRPLRNFFLHEFKLVTLNFHVKFLDSYTTSNSCSCVRITSENTRSCVNVRGVDMSTALVDY